jgi:hypothetical protein
MIKIIKAEPLNAARLRLTFSDGTQGDYDFAPLLAHDTVLTRPLRDPEAFAAFFLELGALCWKNGLELSPAALHHDLRAAGKLVPSLEAA